MPDSRAMTTAEPILTLFNERFGAISRARRMETTSLFVIVVLLAVVSAVWTDFSPVRIVEGLPKIGEYFGKLFSIQPVRGGPAVSVLAWSHLAGGAKEPQSLAYWFYRFDVYAGLLWQTIQMAILATVLGYCGGFLLAFPAARTLTANKTIAFASRRLLEVMRTIPQVVLAFILVWPFGIGPLAGILAIAIHTAGALGKLFLELNENADLRPMEGVKAAGGTWLAQMRYGIVPQMLPGYLSYGLLRFEINVRSSTIIGFVGAGGIGQELRRVIGFNIYEEVSAICILILLIVVVIDLLSERVRHRLIGALA
jgi:phosphonate transport system permease protein